MKTLKDAEIKEGTRVIVRCDFNCPLSCSGEIIDDFRIKASIPTIKYLVEKKAKVILISHLGRPEGNVIENLRLSGVAKSLSSYLNFPVKKTMDCISDKTRETAESLLPKEVLLLENLRFYKEEKLNDENFAKKLSLFADIYINDAFGVCHRKHASVSKITNFLPSFSGLLLEKEVKTLTEVTKNPKRPLIAIFGGAKIETKKSVINKFLEIADFVLVGGKIAREVDFSNSKLVLATDYIGGGLDIGPETQKKFKELISTAGTIVWNGPMGYFEKKEYEMGTIEIAQAIFKNNGFKIAGGGETLYVISKYNAFEKIDFISTGGGAMLKFLAGENLPGIIPLKNNR